MSDIYTVCAVGDRVVRIKFSNYWSGAEPRHASSTGDMDALNPRTWIISVPTQSRTLTTLSVYAVDAVTYDILTLEPFERWNAAQMQLATAGLIIDTDPPTIFTIEAAPFAGSIQKANATETAKATKRGIFTRDIANVIAPAPVDNRIEGGYQELVGGTLVINSAGDYEAMSGDALVRKLIIRRLISRPGDFFHLPDYGAGLGVKETFARNNLPMLAKSIEMQVLQEPEVASAKANVSYSASAGALIIQVQAKIRSTGQQLGVSMNLPIGAVQY